MNALILAGAKPGQPNRALTPIGGRPMIEYVHAAIDAAGMDRIFVAGLDKDDCRLPTADYRSPRLPSGDDMADTLLNGVAALPPDAGRVLVATGDIPFLTAAAVSDFVRRAEALPEAELLYSAVSAAACREKYPGMKRTTLRVAEGEFTGGNLVVIAPSFLRRNEATIRAAWAQRKSVTGLARLLGLGTIFRLLLSRVAPLVLPIAYLERVVGQTLGGVTARLILSPYPEIAADCDREEDIQYAERILTSAERMG